MEQVKIIDASPVDVVRVPKIPLVDVDCSDLEVFIGFTVDDETSTIKDKGIPYKLHVGEIVSVLPVSNFTDQIAMSRLTSFAARQEGQDISPEEMAGSLTRHHIKTPK